MCPATEYMYHVRVDCLLLLLFQGPFVHVASITATLLSKFITSVTGIYEVSVLGLCHLNTILHANMSPADLMQRCV